MGENVNGKNRLPNQLNKTFRCAKVQQAFREQTHTKKTITEDTDTETERYDSSEMIL